MTKLYEPQQKPFDGKVLNVAFAKLDPPDQDIINRQIDVVDTQLSRRMEEKALAGTDRGAGGKTGFGRLSGLEVMAGLGAWLEKLEKTDPEGLASLRKRYARPARKLSKPPAEEIPTLTIGEFRSSI
jgi:hypothetical protein